MPASEIVLRVESTLLVKKKSNLPYCLTAETLQITFCLQGWRNLQDEAVGASGKSFDESDLYVSDENGLLKAANGLVRRKNAPYTVLIV